MRPILANNAADCTGAYPAAGLGFKGIPSDISVFLGQSNDISSLCSCNFIRPAGSFIIFDCMLSGEVIPYVLH